ncbi:alpha-glucosidase [Roseibacterium sp. SDUM158017]|uniref:glycoside hydrolase family 13 protein n=1 Tax=Roseicyclus salinarum TaxID=3036773 RepID=UPI0024155411|nr:alpha-glucosidase [Roseibacterium sp. SDUM158017]MDG4647835.1 alpha-glucosidase [Roseibacterium sp. SDUM158017]
MNDDERWWQAATGYQVYPRSFCDSDGDGVGDLPGIVSKLDHLAELGIGFIWLSPVFASPMADNGYDISDYRAIAPDFGTLSDFDRLVAEAEARGIGIVMDLVVNHTSSDHTWFRAARNDPGAEEHAFYIWREPGPDGGPPDDQQAVFGGPAWHWVEEVRRYHYGHFSAEQPDLNWDNPALRARIWDMMRWWLDRGVRGFRMDVISLIGKDVDARIYEEGPTLHAHLQEMHREVLAGRDLVSIGETWGVSTATAPLYSGRARGELDMVFQFAHVTEGWDPVRGKWAARPFDVPAFKRVMNAWQEALAEDGWNALFLSNHDLPRQVSRYGSDGKHRVASAKALATVMHLMKGTPFVYQGEEIGMTNAGFTRIDQYRDLETLRHYAGQIAAGVPPEAFLAGARAFSRDNARTPMQWTGGPNAGFTAGTPWIEANPNHAKINVEADKADPDGIFHHYRRLIALRRDMAIVRHGRYRPHLEAHPAIFAYSRAQDGERLVVVANLSPRAFAEDMPDWLPHDGETLIASHGAPDLTGATLSLRPYESFCIHVAGEATGRGDAGPS